MKWLHLEETESTNDYAKHYVQKNACTDILVVSTSFQTAGKGQQNKTWVSAKNQNILLSICFHPTSVYKGDSNNLFQFLASISLGCRAFLQEYTQEHVWLKWTNDIYVKDKKIGGILIENIFQSKLWQYTIVGIGININQTEFHDLKKAISLQQITHQTYHLNELYHVLVDSVISHLQHPENYLEAYKSCMYKMHQYVTVEFKHTGKRAEVYIKDVLPNGQLVISHEHKDITMRHGSIIFCIP